MFAADFEAGHLPATQHRLERAADDRDIKPEIGDTVAVDLHLELRLVQLQIGVEIGQARILLQPFDHGVAVFLQVLIGAGCLDDEFDRTPTAATSEAAGRAGIDLGAGDLAQFRL